MLFQCDRTRRRLFEQVVEAQMLGSVDVAMFKRVVCAIDKFAERTDCDVDEVRKLRVPEAVETFGDIAAS